MDAHDGLDEEKASAYFCKCIGEAMVYRGYKIQHYLTLYDYGILSASNGLNYARLQLDREPIEADYYRMMEFIDQWFGRKGWSGRI